MAEYHWKHSLPVVLSDLIELPGHASTAVLEREKLLPAPTILPPEEEEEESSDEDEEGGEPCSGNRADPKPGDAKRAWLATSWRPASPASMPTLRPRRTPARSPCRPPPDPAEYGAADLATGSGADGRCGGRWRRRVAGGTEAAEAPTVGAAEAPTVGAADAAAAETRAPESAQSPAAVQKANGRGGEGDDRCGEGGTVATSGGPDGGKAQRQQEVGWRGEPSQGALAANAQALREAEAV